MIDRPGAFRRRPDSEVAVRVARSIVVVVVAALVASIAACTNDRAGSELRSRSAGELSATELARVETPVSVVQRPGTGDLYVATVAGQVLRLEARGGRRFRLDDAPVLDLATGGGGGERGTFALLFSPDGDDLYVSFTDPALEWSSVVARYRMNGAVPAPDSRLDVLVVPQPWVDHKGGALAWGPDGFLYVALGDGGYPKNSIGDLASTTSQDPDVLYGKVLRIDPRSSTPDAPYAIPPDNPFADGASGRPEIWALGLRNPWRMSFDVRTGDLWIADVGAVHREEINVLRRSDGGGRGVNLGWRFREGTVKGSQQGDPPPGLVDPVYDYPHVGGEAVPRAVTGGYVYRGRRLPELRGHYLFSDWGEGGLRSLSFDADGRVRHRTWRVDGRRMERLTGFGQGLDDEIYMLAVSGAILRLDPAGRPR